MSESTTIVGVLLMLPIAFGAAEAAGNRRGGYNYRRPRYLGPNALKARRI